MQTNKYTFSFKKSLCQEVYIESITREDLEKDFNEKSSLFFIDEYKQTIKVLKEIVENNKAVEQKTGNREKCGDKSNCKKYSISKNESRNNLILFTGQRGSGKTSATKSIAGYLEKNDCEGVRFKCLPMVDPSYFDKNTNIIKTVLSTMFDMAKCIMEHREENDDNKGGFERLLRSFDDVFTALGKMDASKETSYTLEALNEFSKASELKGLMQKLIDQFIRILPQDENGGKSVDYLVLVIDDVDMNVSYAATMLEQIRKFLMLDHLIILMSANLEQLQNEMCEYYSRAFIQTLKGSNDDLVVDVEDLATKYLLKIFPTSRRIHVEKPSERLLGTELRIISDNSDIVPREGDLQNLILTMIWEKTRLLFVPKNAEKGLGANNRVLHPIIPTNLRELAHFLEMLVSLKDIPTTAKDKNGNNTEERLFPTENDYEECRKNFYLFRNYILKNWIPNRLSVEEESVFENIPSDITEINKHLINSINVIGTKHKKRLMSREVDLEIIARNAEGVKIDRDIYTMVSPNDPRFVKANKISDIFNQPSNYSYGDLLLMIDKYETYFESDEDRRFTNAIKIYYSMLLFEIMFFNSSDVQYSYEIKGHNQSDETKTKENEQKETKQSTTILDSDIPSIPIQRLIGGTMYYPNYFEIITSKYFSQKGPSYDAKRAFYHKVDVKNTKENCPLFSILYYGDVRPDRYDMKHIYDTTYENDSDVDGTKYVTFDILSILNNMLNPWQTIKRYLGVEKDQNSWNINIEEWKKGIKRWEKECSLVRNPDSKHKKISFPNSILPFYSVDLMLCYLRNLVPASDLIGGEEEFDDYKKKANLYRDFLKKESPDIPFGNQDKVLKSNKTILNEAHKCYVALSFKCTQDQRFGDVVDNFRNHVIALIMANYEGGSKDRDALIKELHKHQSVSEIMLFVAEALWRDAVLEQCVRKEIQNEVHGKEAVEQYYEKLWGKTETSINEMVDSGLKTDSNTQENVIVKVYNNIYETAKDVFIKEIKPSDTEISKK